MHDGGRVVRVAHVRLPSGIEMSTAADNIEAVQRTVDGR
ncbi:hypothetical protein M878_16325 [Streptomyces roseochromogenus subsp. oscitans DS 12.976]|uniref:Uncharacterized protein n=1 Tax=Streptomyces roseochromogenus subsp. oscitans DS 12.976 TaxID=1352936 RepID=V6KRG0_STRRC|nr:hypothetical protein M878_16325 [Streptomyces roseochromogenus subsp. oscitans DS 12.976]